MLCGISLRRKRVAVFFLSGKNYIIFPFFRPSSSWSRKKQRLSGNSNSTGSCKTCPTRLSPTSISCCEDTWYPWRSPFPNSFLFPVNFSYRENYPSRTRVKSARKVEAQLARSTQVDQSETSTPGLSETTDMGPTSTRLFHRKCFLTFRTFHFYFDFSFYFCHEYIRGVILAHQHTHSDVSGSTLTRRKVIWQEES